MLSRWHSAGLLLLIAVLSAPLWAQRFMLYFPPSFVPSPEKLQKVGLCRWEDPISKEFYGYQASSVPVKVTGTLLAFHGNANTAFDQNFMKFQAAGFRVLLIEYPGYGEKTGWISEASFVAAARRAIHSAQQTFPEPVFLAGASLGSGVVGAVTKSLVTQPLTAPIAGVLLVTPWDTLASRAKAQYPKLIVTLLLRDKYATLENLANFRQSIVIVGAGKDTVIPVHHAKTLSEQIPSTFFLLEDATHTNWSSFLTPEKVQDISTALRQG